MIDKIAAVVKEGNVGSGLRAEDKAGKDLAEYLTGELSLRLAVKPRSNLIYRVMITPSGTYYPESCSVPSKRARRIPSGYRDL